MYELCLGLDPSLRFATATAQRTKGDRQQKKLVRSGGSAGSSRCRQFNTMPVRAVISPSLRFDNVGQP